MDGKFIVGLLIGTVLGSSATYFITRKAFAMKATDAIEAYAEYADEKIRRAEGKSNEEENTEEEQPKKAKDDVVKKYYHQYAPQIDEKELKMTKEVENEVKENIKAAVNENTKKALENELREKDYISEVTEDDFIGSEEKYEVYDRITLDFLFPQNELFWGYDTDCQEEAEMHYHEEREDIIGQCWRWATDYTDNETGTGVAYIRNDKMQAFFEVVFHVDMELEATGKYDID